MIGSERVKRKEGCQNLLKERHQRRIWEVKTDEANRMDIWVMESWPIFNVSIYNSDEIRVIQRQRDGKKLLDLVGSDFFYIAKKY